MISYEMVEAGGTIMSLDFAFGAQPDPQNRSWVVGIFQLDQQRWEAKSHREMPIVFNY